MSNAVEWNWLSKGGGAIVAAIAILATLVAAPQEAHGQMPSVLYTWDTPGGLQDWAKAFGDNAVTLQSSITGELTITETGAAGGFVAIADGANRVRESSTASNGGTDLTGLDFLEFDLGHNGSGPINVQFYVQGSPGFTYKALGPDLPVTPGMNTYKVPLAGLTADEIVYLRTMGFNARAHTAVGNVTWTLREVRSSGTPLTTRDLITHNTGSAEGGLQGAIANFDVTAIAGNDGGQNQTGLSHNPAGSGSLQWTDLGGSNGAAITWGNGTAWNGNSFNNRTTDLGGYTEMIVRMSALDAVNPAGSVNVQGFFQKNGFSFEAAGGGVSKALPTNGQYKDLTFSLTGMLNMNVVEMTGINLGSHANNLLVNVDNIKFRRVQLASHTLFSWENGLEGWTQGPDTGHVHSIVSQGATQGVTALQIDRRSVPGTGTTTADDNFVVGSQYTTTNAATIQDLVTRINGARSIAFDVTFEDQFPINPDYTNFFVILSDGTGAFYQAGSANININGAVPGSQRTMELLISDFNDATPGSTKNLAIDGLSLASTSLSIAIASSTNGGAVYQIDNFRLISEVPQLRADFNGDQVVDALDLNIWKSGAGADANEDGVTDGNDFLIWQREYSATHATAVAAAVPEPAAPSLALMASLALVGRRRR